MANSDQSANPNVLAIRSQRFEVSPFLDCHSDPDMMFGVYAGRFYTVSNGVSSEDAYWALRRKAVMVDVPERPVEISGPDSTAFLDFILARRIATLSVGRGRYVVACTHEGGLFMDGVLLRLEANRYWFVQSNGDLETWLLAHRRGFDVTVSDPRARALQIQGPASLSIMARASNGAINRSLGYFHSGYFELGGQRVYVSRTGWSAELGYELYVEWDRTDCHSLWDHMLASGEPDCMLVPGANGMETRRIEAGILDNQTDFDSTMNPWEAGLGGYVDLDKETDFIGREALCSTTARETRIYGIRCIDAMPKRHDSILDGNNGVGRVTVGAWSPFQECGIGYVRFDEPGDWADRPLMLASDTDGQIPCTSVSLPFYDAAKRIPRGLDRAIP